jgi:hypothetical protein
VLLGTAFSFVQLLEGMDNLPPIQLPAGSRILETGGYKGRSREMRKSELHSLIARQLGVRPDHIASEYGMSELSSQAYDMTVGALPAVRRREFRFPPWARVVIVSPETGREVDNGDSGIIRIYDLANVASVMAIETEDIGVRRGEAFELIGRAAAAEARGCSLMVSSG